MRVSRNFHRYEVTKDDNEFLLISDIHWDNPHCDLDLLRNHLDEAKRRGARVMVNGDFFCLMQGRGDPRRSKDEIRPEHSNGRYLDSIVETAVEWFAPYANVLQFIGYGNHETSVIKNQETDILQRFADVFNLTHRPENPIEVGGYGGAIAFSYRPYQDSGASTKVMKYFHGSGGGGIVTKGVIQNQRAMAIYQGYDIIWMGHVHELYHHTDIVERFMQASYQVEQRAVDIVRTSTYKDEYEDGAQGWHIERGAGPKPLGGYWLKFDIVKSKRDKDGRKPKDFIISNFNQCTRTY